MDTPDNKALVPAREETVNFYGDQVTAAQLADGTILIPLRPIVEALGLNWSGQRQRTQRDSVLGEALTECVIHSIQGDRAMLSLPLNLLPGWLFGISDARVKPELREKIGNYRRECFTVLWEHFKGQVMPAVQLEQASGAERALQIAEAVVEIARQQVELEKRHNTMADYMRGHVRKVNAELVEVGQRLTALELQVGGAATISEGQALEIAGAVKAVAAALSEKGEKNAYQRVYSELYRRFGVSGYKNLPTAQYDAAIAWLKSWHEEIISV